MKVEHFLTPEALKMFNSVEKARLAIREIDGCLVSKDHLHQSPEWRAGLIECRHTLCESENVLVEALIELAKQTPTHPMQAFSE